jgi:LuxR family maltose regulon positive regulatory protein
MTAPTEELTLDEAFALIDRHLDSIAKLREHIDAIRNEQDYRVRAAAGLAEGIDALTEREAKTMRLMYATPLSLPQIARRMFVSANTTKTHAKAIYRKLGVHNRAEMVERLKGLGYKP